MGKGGKIASDIITHTIVSPFLKQLAKEKREEDRRYNKFLNQVDQNILAEEEAFRKKINHYDVCQNYDPMIHEHDFW